MRTLFNGGAAEPAVRACVRVPIDLGNIVVDADVWTFHGLVDSGEHLAIGLGDYKRAEPPLVRPHSECLTGEVFGSLRCDCGPQLKEALQTIQGVGGYVLYLRQEGRGIGLYNKLDAYSVQDCGLDTYAANSFLGFEQDARRYEVASQMLRALDVNRVALLTNNPDKVKQIVDTGIEVEAVRNTGYFATEENETYLYAKVAQTGHWSATGCAAERRPA